MTENKRFRDSATPEERGIVLERLKNNETSAAIAFDMGLTLKVVCDIRNDALEHGELTLPIEERPGLTSYKVQQYCIANNLFNRGSYERYERMLELAGAGFPALPLCDIIYGCNKGNYADAPRIRFGFDERIGVKGKSDVWTFKVGNNEASQGSSGRQALGAVRQADA